MVMGGHSRIQKEKVKQFCSVTGASDDDAKAFLGSTGWNVEVAVDSFFASGASRKAGGAAQALADLFEQYMDKEEKRMMADGVIRFLEDLGVDPADPVTLVIAYHMDAKTTGEMTREEFMQGMQRMRASSLADLKARVPELKKSLENPSTFKEIYNFSYTFSCPKGQKCLQLDESIMLWELLLGDKGNPHLGKWIDFLREHHRRAINKDTWAQFLDFMHTIKSDFSNYDADGGAWPYLLDEFVEKCKQGA